MGKNKKFTDYFYNPLTYFGVGLASVIFFIECMLFVIDFMSKDHNVYLGIITYCFLPPFLLLGLILIPIGALRRRKRILKGLENREPKKFHIDFSNPKHRNLFFIFVIGTIVLLFMSAVGAYKAFHYTESVQFCGTVCHQVMKPEYTTYKASPHARVKCVECHIGSGADWYVRSKLSGIRQVYHTIKQDYARPIETPVHNLRPAKETCEQCHWPNKFYSSVEMRRQYYPSYEGEADSWLLRMLIPVGSEDKSKHGIHAHMYIDNDIYYVAEDYGRQNITWVKSVHPDGTKTIYTSPDSKYKSEAPPEELIRKMDCMDCHNRPAHHFDAPYELVNNAFVTGEIDPGIPDAKLKIMEVLSEDYESSEEAMKNIEENLNAYYSSEYPEYYSNHPDKIETMIAETKKIFSGDFFPYMKARWDKYPDNIGHLVSPGCFRCHDGMHEAESGKVITKDCTVCHTIIEQGPPDSPQQDINGLDFIHPFEDDGLWKEMQCTDCHTGN